MTDDNPFPLWVGPALVIGHALLVIAVAMLVQIP